MSNIFDNTQSLTKALDDKFHDRRWMSLLETFVVTGVADTGQMQLFTALDRDRVSRALQYMDSIYLGDRPLLHKLERTIPRPGQSKRPANIYLLNEGGAKLLREQGYQVRACELKENTPILHALAMLTVHLSARQNGLTIETDINVPYGDGKVFRPDHRIQTANGRFLIMEVEQTANVKLLPRIRESLANRQAFFNSEASRGYLREVRIVFNINEGNDLRRTLNVWENAIQNLREQSGEGLSYRILSTSLINFSKNPEWGETVSDRFRNLELESEKRFPFIGDDGEPKLVSVKTPAKGDLSKDVIILEALSQEFTKNFGEVKLRQDFDLFEIADTIYGGSYEYPDKWETIRDVGKPVQSLYLYKEFLRRHADLRSRIKATMHHRESRMYWNHANILNRMNQVAQEFLAYFGWTVERMGIYAGNSSYHPGNHYGFTMSANIEPGEEGAYSKAALLWMLRALFEYGDDLELGRPDFW